MEFNNTAAKWEKKPESILEPFLLLLAPYAPHLAEKLWEKRGHSTTLAYESWSQWNPDHLEVKCFDLPVQVNGKMRGTITVAKGIDKEAALSAALQAAFVRSVMEGKDIRRVIFVPDRIINLTVK